MCDTLRVHNSWSGPSVNSDLENCFTLLFVRCKTEQSPPVSVVLFSALTVPSAPPQNLTLEVQNSKVSRPFPPRCKNTNNNRGRGGQTGLEWWKCFAWPQSRTLLPLCGSVWETSAEPPVHLLAGGKLPSQMVLKSAAQMLVGTRNIQQPLNGD